jgi:predicted lipoprotein with Yx(FWY)xxD motif
VRRGLRTTLVAGLLALVGCGAEDAEQPAATATPTPTATPMATEEARAGTRITLARSEFGTMLFGPEQQAIYIFERDPKGKTVCYGECAEAWPPVYTGGEPVAGKGVTARLLGTVERRDGRRQVTYAGQPLYYYAHEGPGEVRCHDVNLNGGYWWVVGPSGRRR